MVMNAIVAIVLAAGTAQQASSLPQAESFRSAVPGIVDALHNSFLWTMFRGDFLARRDFLAQANLYSYNEKETSITQDRTERTETNGYQITRGPEVWQMYRKQISRNDSPLPGLEMEEQGRAHEKRESAARTVIAQGDIRSDSEKKKKEEQSTQFQQAVKDDLLVMFDIRVLGRDRIDNIPVLSLELKPKSGYKPRTGFTEGLKDFRTIRAWVTESDHVAVRVSADNDKRQSEEYAIAVLEKGSILSIERRFVNGEFWLPTRIEVTNRRARSAGRLGPPQRVITEFSDFKKFTVDTSIRPMSPVQ